MKYAGCQKYIIRLQEVKMTPSCAWLYFESYGILLDLVGAGKMQPYKRGVEHLVQYASAIVSTIWGKKCQPNRFIPIIFYNKEKEDLSIDANYYI